MLPMVQRRRAQNVVVSNTRASPVTGIRKIGEGRCNRVFHVQPTEGCQFIARSVAVRATVPSCHCERSRLHGFSAQSFGIATDSMCFILVISYRKHTRVYHHGCCIWC
ncbi:hypothetical protein BDN70DRAFT_654119 [Pholiota conissans]|uniref:Uncharacterized protein n=1 Tax=Pholiota conissans TaxID=109636 RepID=A0A9P5YK49_9AGAR|nr:hypothetical protein BDN70DRAFT_654119 [Pholiota conissans]